MPAFRTSAVVLAVRAHGEHGTVARFLTAERGMIAAYVRGGRSRAMRPVLMAGNGVTIDWRARSEEQLGHAAVELVESRGAWHGEPLAADAIGWATTLTAAALPEEAAYPRVHAALGGLLDAVCHAPSARRWVEALVRYELLLLAELGFGLDLTSCAATGDTADLAFVSPKSARAVGRGAAAGHERALLPLPAFLADGTQPDWPALFGGLRLSGHFVAASLIDPRRTELFDARSRLIDRLKRAAV